jgi:hypothetical protein
MTILVKAHISNHGISRIFILSFLPDFNYYRLKEMNYLFIHIFCILFEGNEKNKSKAFVNIFSGK